MRLRSHRRKMKLSDFEMLKTIGRGAFGEVRLVKFKETGEVFAMKIMLKESLVDKNQVEHIRAERDVMTLADKQWIVTLYYTFQDDENLYMIEEYCSGGDMMGLLIRKDIFSEAATKFFICEMILGINSLHKIGYIHRDLKPDNFLLTSTGHVKLTDMGLCKKLDGTIHLSRQSTLHKSSAELVKEEDFTATIGTHRARELAYSTVGTADDVAPAAFEGSGDGNKINVPPARASHSRSPHGERGLKYFLTASNICFNSRSPHGERGLKYNSSRENWPRWVAPLTGSVD